VTSEVGVGSCFVLTIPTDPQVSIEPIGGTADSRPILLIDDEESARYITRQLFRGTKRAILESSDGWQGAERARFEQPALIVLDLMLGGVTGFDVIEELKADPMTRDIPVVIQTSKVLTTADRDRLGAKAASIMPKSGNRAEALRLIREILHESALFIDEPEFTGREAHA
jgi:CheY-like chemotaxis protein